MKYLAYYFLFVVLSAASCHTEEVDETDSLGCQSDNALEQVAWLKEKVNDLTKQSAQFKCSDKEEGCFYIARGDVNGETIFEVGNCCPNMNSVPAFFKCDGTSFCEAGDIDCIRKTTPDGRKLLWSSRIK
ncbi:hypothetical protein [Dyadobacter luticola]|uniref:Uncharacterized protein n=1 Tax=Dyadobacter luticola TaxID=1979387 RepID=A0A5R9L2F9_9BACT|nr:hypothetical protein [Dyadobacter luticola]TLV02485.1 hypothetical protein FEN17_02330 [Dyadobacter luticola]